MITWVVTWQLVRSLVTELPAFKWPMMTFATVSTSRVWKDGFKKCLSQNIRGKLTPSFGPS